ncbi:transcriptional regulator, TetR family [Aliivibrio fischeri ES114]|uniref:Transcriptional regulator, TetR family n=1 Tax=Aliivibrio fischeri (strain ATCC 700601 / ES114) TaxID=312309 RepID=Q5E1I3_ALIF1|nr:TetR/AcrR family transcriptional regulator [Aliivibrio fischeri]AAW87113.1 transcriptional regulator, TetR family [Aliivibrio fischeri ES114]KLU80758.1 TetR family transcriptional regulator [Aliivibrio fischeri]MUJ19958.1 TetR family transcriptional regulator [Aliivibrio fischeri]MUK42982.1 TetR family transcriptional regulator [Aliivibrio fischeri]MUL16965.1 TetR family transcriptional regulator [Aliivibrio fischeri]
MTEKKQGKRSTETAEQTKCQILMVAATMFGELGYERVSLRNISEKAGVSHSLIRHHFGSKDMIWKAICDACDKHMQTYLHAIIASLPTDKTPSYRIYLFIVKLSAFTLMNPQPIKMIADAIRQDDNALLEYFLKTKCEFESIFKDLFEEYNQVNPESKLDIWETKWQMLIFSHGASSLTPMMSETWPQFANNQEKLLLQHWNLFNQIMAAKFSITKEQMLCPTELNELLIDVQCPLEQDITSSELIE